MSDRLGFPDNFMRIFGFERVEEETEVNETVNTIEEYMPPFKVFAIDDTLKSLSIWPDMPEDRNPTIGNVIDFVNNFRRGNQEVWCSGLPKQQAGYILSGCTRSNDNSLILIYHHPKDIVDPSDGKMLRDAVIAIMTRERRDDGRWDILSTIGFATWSEEQKEVVNGEPKTVP